MDYSKLISITGLSGLYELIASKSDGAIVHSLDDKTTKFVSSRMHNFSHLESIEVYTQGDNVNLVDVFHAMQNNTEPLPAEKDAAAIKKYFEKVYPEIDFDRVYMSDMKKMVKWFDILKKNGVEIKLSEAADTTEEEEPETQEAEVKEAETTTAEESKKVKAAKTKKAEPVAAKEDVTDNSEPQAAKKKTAKK